MIFNDIHSAELLSSNQTIKAGVELYKGSTLEKVCNCNDTLSSLTVERSGEGKFFGFGICQELKVELIDIEREINLSKENTIKVFFTVGGNTIYPFPTFYVDTVERDETTNSINVTAFDALGAAATHTVAELNITYPTPSIVFASWCASILGIGVKIGSQAVSDAFYSFTLDTAPNFDGNESLREALNDLAEATQTIYFINYNNELEFKRLTNINEEHSLTINKDLYYSLKNNGLITLGKVVSATELGDNVAAVEPNSVKDGVAQYIRDNAFWTLREDVAAQVNTAQINIGGTRVNQFECEWGGNYLLEIGDLIYLQTEDNKYIESYLLDDSISFDGALSQSTRWQYNENDSETPENPSSLGDMLNKTIARVDKVNQTIELRVQSMKDEVAGDIGANASAIAALQINADSISSSVTALEKKTDGDRIVLDAFVQKAIITEQTAEALKINVNKIETEGVTKVETNTGFTFDEKGLLVEKTDSENKTLITENGMTVKKVIDSVEEEVLTANSQGVTAVDLKATTYLIIGDHSRFETYQDVNNEYRTGCFWLG